MAGSGWRMAMGRAMWMDVGEEGHGSGAEWEIWCG